MSRRRDGLVDAMQAQRHLMQRARQARLSTTEWCVLTAITDLITSYSRLSDTLSRETIAEAAGVSVATARRAVDRLVEMRLIEVEVRRGRGRSNLFTVPEAPTKTAHGRAEDEPFSEPDPEPKTAHLDGVDADKTAHGPTQIEPLPGRTHSGEKAAAARLLDDDPDEGVADALVAKALLAAGCDWLNRRALRRGRDLEPLVGDVAVLVRHGHDPADLYDLLATPPDVPVRSWPGLMRSRLPGYRARRDRQVL